MKRGRQPQIPFTPTQPLETILRREARQRGLSLSALIREALLHRYAPQIAALEPTSPQGGAYDHLDRCQSATASTDDASDI